MFSKILTKVFGSRNERILKNMQKTVDQINQYVDSYRELSDDELKAKTPHFKKRLQDGESLNSLIPEVFATVREVSTRVLGLRHFDVQLIGGLVLHEGKIAEMRTGEGKTLVATLPVYLNALTGKGVHVITVNDYLAQRDSKWMGPIYEFLGMSVGVIITDLSSHKRQEAYNSDITYGTNNEFGFDYLRDNMAFELEEKVQRELHYAVVDEVDSILIDEARTPLIISGAAENSSELYKKIDVLVPKLTRQQTEEGEGDYFVDEKAKQVFLTEEGHQKVESMMQSAGLIQEGSSLYSAQNISFMHYLNASLRAHALFSKDVDYVVRDNQVVIVDEHTGRTMPGRRWSEGLHQAVEAKERVTIQNENQTLASITFQNYFKLYDKIAGMTGTADTEAYEFQQIYNLEVIVIPTNEPMVRDDESDLIFLTKEEKYQALIEDVKECQERKQPVLLGTASIETSEYLSDLLNKEKIKHQVLNAKFHEKEAQIIAEAGRPGTVTIATNMAGRGTDIVLGGSLDVLLSQLGEDATEKQKEKIKQEWDQDAHQKVIQSGGLRVIGSERHESRRIDNQLRGRSGRQGDSGSTRFYLSLEDNLLRIFASERVAGMMKRLGMKEGDSIEHSWITKAIENAQRKVEGRNFDIRKQLLEFDNVANEQRHVIYHQRAGLLKSNDIHEVLDTIKMDVIENLINQHIPPDSMAEQWDVPGLEKQINNDFGLHLEISKWLDVEDELDEENLRKRILDTVNGHIDDKEAQIGAENMRHLEKALMLQSLDLHWREHLSAMDHLRQGIHLRGYAQKDPKQEYKREAFALFSELLDSVKYQVVNTLSTIEVKEKEDIDAVDETRRRQSQRALNYEHTQRSAMQDAERPQNDNDYKKAETVVRAEPKVGRNDPCPCNSGKKYKNCHGKIA